MEAVVKRETMGRCEEGRWCLDLCLLCCLKKKKDGVESASRVRRTI